MPIPRGLRHKLILAHDFMHKHTYISLPCLLRYYHVFITKVIWQAAFLLPGKGTLFVFTFMAIYSNFLREKSSYYMPFQTTFLSVTSCYCPSWSIHGLTNTQFSDAHCHGFNWRGGLSPYLRLACSSQVWTFSYVRHNKLVLNFPGREGYWPHLIHYLFKSSRH